jgi:pectinesterase
MHDKILLFLVYSVAFALTFQIAQSQNRYDFIVDQNGTGDFKTVQEAINHVPDLRKNRTTIFIKTGTYHEKLIIGPTKTNLTLIGENATNTILTFDDYASKKNIFGEEIGTSGSSSTYVFAEGFIAKNITFENTSGLVGQAVAIRIDGDKVIFDNCRFLGFQDTLYPHGENSRQYYRNCYIEGTVDFIFGWSTVIFYHCEIYCKEKGYTTAASTTENTKYGFVFMDCKITGSTPENSFYLGRPWRPFAKTVFINCFLDKQIKSEGWHNWDKPDAEHTAYYAEYNSLGPGAKSSERVPWSHQLSDQDLKNYSIEKIFDGWNPLEFLID